MPNTGRPQVRLGDSREAASVCAFQKWARLEADAVVGQKTWDAASSLKFMIGSQYVTVRTTSASASDSVEAA